MWGKAHKHELDCDRWAHFNVPFLVELLKSALQTECFSKVAFIIQELEVNDLDHKAWVDER